MFQLADKIRIPAGQRWLFIRLGSTELSSTSTSTAYGCKEGVVAVCVEFQCLDIPLGCV